MKIKIRKVVTAAVLVAFGFGLGIFMAPTTAQSVGCINGGGKSAFLECPGSYEFTASIRAGTDITDCQIVKWYSGNKLYHSAIVTVVKK